MARIRTVKPEYFTHPEIAVLSIPARLLLISLWTQADDEGRLYDQPRRICANAFGDGDRVRCERLLEELAAKGRIIRYESQSKPCIQVTSFKTHQRIDKPKPSVIPEPSTTAQGGILDASTTVPGRIDDTSQEEWNGKEGNREKEGKGMDMAPGKPVRRRDADFEALAEEEGIDWQNGALTQRARSALNAALSDIRSAGNCTPEEIHRRSGFLRSSLDVPFTANSLAKYWPRLANGPLPRGRPARSGSGMDLLEQARRTREVEDAQERSGRPGGLPRLSLPDAT